MLIYSGNFLEIMISLQSFATPQLLILIRQADAKFPENKKPLKDLTFKGFLLKLADRTGLEPATSAVTGRHSNQLNYRSVSFGLQI